MLQRPDLVEAFERERIAREPPDYHRSLRIFEALWQEAVLLGVLPVRDPLEGIEAKIEFVQALHVRPPAGPHR